MAKKKTKETSVKTTVDLPQSLWREAKIRALDEGTDFRRVVIAALESYLYRRPLPFKVKEGGRVLFSSNGISAWIKKRQGR